MASPRELKAMGAICALCGVLALSSFGSMAEPSRASSVAFYVPQMAVPNAPHRMQNKPPASEPQMAVPMPQVTPQMQTMPEVQQMTAPSVEMPQVVEMPTAVVLPAAEGQANSLPFLGGFLGGVIAGGAFAFSLLKKTGQNVAMEAQKLELGALASVAVESISVAPAPALNMNTGRGRMRAVVNMSAMDKPAGFLENKDKRELYQLCKPIQKALSVATAAAVTLPSEAAHAVDANVAQVSNLVATNANDFGGNTIPIIGLGVLVATISLLAGPVEE